MSRIPNVGPITPQRTVDQNGEGLEGLDLDQFLSLMVTEMQNQDPLNPMDNSQIVSQISQLREIGATDQLTQTLNAVLMGQNLGTASGLIGKEITALSDSLENISGVVQRVSVEAGEDSKDERSFKLHVASEDAEHVIDLKNVREVSGET